MAKKLGNMIGGWAFLIGVVLAIIFGFLGNVSTTITYILIAVGLIVGLLNVTSEEATPFLMSGTVLIIASFFGQVVVATIPQLQGILGALLLVFVPATILVSIRNVFNLARR
ncbi:MAG: hypothetical protein AABX48_00060 [Nanoarchaeota archaeon]|nr:hypothetical protein [Nanoarchaeota archaeon]